MAGRDQFVAVPTARLMLAEPAQRRSGPGRRFRAAADRWLSHRPGRGTALTPHGYLDASDVHARVTPFRRCPGLRPMAVSVNSVRSSKTRARARVGLVSSWRVALRHTGEGDEKDVGDRARVGDVVHFARSLDERLPRAVCGGLALAADRLVNGERALLDDYDRASGM